MAAITHTAAYRMSACQDRRSEMIYSADALTFLTGVTRSRRLSVG